MVGYKRNVRFMKKRPAKKEATLAPEVSKAVNKVVKRAMHRTEETKRTANDSSTAVSTTTQPVGFLYPVQGTASNERIGDNIENYSFRMNYTLVWSGDLYNVCRIIIFQWHPDDVPVTSEIFFPSINPGSIPILQYEEKYSQQFKVLYDKIHIVTGAAAGVPNSNSLVNGRVFIPQKKLNKISKFRAFDSSDCTNKIYFLVLSDSNVTTHPVCRYSYKFEYKDA